MANYIDTSSWRLPPKTHKVPEASFTDDMYRRVGLPVPVDPTPTTGGSGFPVVDTSEWRLPVKSTVLEEEKKQDEASGCDGSKKQRRKRIHSPKPSLSDQRYEQRKLAGLEPTESLRFATGSPHRKMPLAFDEEDPDRSVFGKQSDEDRAHNLIWSAAHIAGAKEDIEKLAAKLKIPFEKLVYDAYDRRIAAIMKGARPTTGTKNDPKAEMMALAASARALKVHSILAKAAAKHSPKKESAVTSEMRRLSGITEDANLPRPINDTRALRKPQAHGILDNGVDEGEAYVQKVLSESRWFFDDRRPLTEAPGGRRTPWRGSADEPAETPIVRKGQVHGTVGQGTSPEAGGEVDVGRSEIDYDFDPDEGHEKQTDSHKGAKKAPSVDDDSDDEDDDEEEDEDVQEGIGKRLKGIGQKMKAAGHRAASGRAAQRAKTGLATSMQKFAKKHGIDTDAFHKGQEKARSSSGGGKAKTAVKKPSYLKKIKKTRQVPISK